MPHNVSDYKRKIVQGLYAFDHFEHADGSFVQSNSEKFVHLNKRDGTFRTFYSYSELVAYLATID